MDTQTLMGYAIAALFGAVAKAFIEWIIGLLRSAWVAQSARDFWARIATRKNWDVFTSILSILFYSSVLTYFAVHPGVPGRLEILLAIGAVIAVLVMAANLLVRLAAGRQA